MIEEARARVYAKVASLANLAPDEISPETTLEGVGLDSSDAVLIALEIEELTGTEVDVAIFLRFETLGEAMEELARSFDWPALRAGAGATGGLPGL